MMLLRNLLNEESPILRLIAYSIMLHLLLTAAGLVLRVCYNVEKNQKLKGKYVYSKWRL